MAQSVCAVLEERSTFTFSHFADAFYPKLLTIGEYIKRFILKRQTDKIDNYFLIYFVLSLSF